MNVLDDLDNPLLDHRVLERRLIAMRGPLETARVEPDPLSLPTRRLCWADGLEVEVKDHQLGALAPWRACAGCPKKQRCREGIHALRLGQDGRLRTCMDRPDLGVALAPILEAGGPAALSAAVRRFVVGHARTAA